MDPNLPSPKPRKVKFRPKPPRKDSKPVATVRQAVDNDDSDENTQLLTREVDKHHGVGSQGSKREKKSSGQVVALTHGGPSTGLRSKQKGKVDGSNAARSEGALLDESQSLTASMSTPQNGDTSFNDPNIKKKKDYREPWDYENSNYPVTLPWRPPYSGNPELLDEEEFENPQEYDERTINPAKDLHLLDQNEEQLVFLVQLNATLPIGPNGKPQERIATLKGKEKTTGKKASGSSTNPSLSQGSHLTDIPEGIMGKMLVYKHGGVKLKLGDILFEVRPGTPCSCAQNFASINTSNGQFCELGDMDKERMVITPHIDGLVD